MTQNNHVRLIRLLAVFMLLMLITSLLAQDTPTETPTDIPTTVSTDAPTSIPTEEASAIPTDAPTDVPTIVPTDAPTSIPTEEAAGTETPTEAVSASAVPSQVATDVVITTPVVDTFAPEPSLTLVLRDLFEEDTLPAHWTLPAGWALTSVTDGKSVQISATSAGPASKATLSDVYGDVAVMGYFTFTDQTGTAQLAVHESVNGEYIASLDASGLVTLAKHDSTGAAVILDTSSLQMASSTSHSLRLSVMGDVLRVAVDNVTLIAVQDAAPLPAGTVSTGIVFPAATGILLFDNFFLWTPQQAETATPVTPTKETVTPVPTQSLPPTEAVPSSSSNMLPAAAPLPMAGLTPPALTAPALNSTSTTLTPTFSWSAIPGANQYHLIVATNFSCATVVIEKFLTTPYFVPTAPLDQGEYWFCVESQNTTNGTASGFGEKRHFTINISLSPAEGSVIFTAAGATTASLPFKWTDIVGQTESLQVAYDSSFSSFFYNQGVPLPPTFTLTQVPFGTYYWRVLVGGNALPQSLAHHVTISPPLPLAPTIQTPAPIPHLGSTNDTTPAFDWNVPANWVTPPSGQSLTYELQLSTNNSFTALVAPTVTGLPTSDYEWTATTLANTPGTVYYWRVRARTNLGLYSLYSSTYSFTLDTDAPPPPTTLTAPLDNAVSTAALPVFSWGAVPGANRYKVDISMDSGFGAGTLIPVPLATAATFTPNISLAQGVYYWQVWSMDAAGNTSLTPSATRTLRVDYVTAPVDGSVKALVGAAASGTVAFSWTPVTGLTGAVYTVTIYTDNLLTHQQATSGLIATAAWTSPALPIGQYWWVLTVGGGMGTSITRRVVVSPPMPGAPVTPFVPAALAFTNDTTPTFNWGTPTLNPSNIADYELQISTVSTFASQATGSPYVVTNRPFEITTALPDSAGQVYYWRVRAHTALNAYGPYSAPMSFTLDTTRPNAPLSLTAPLDNAVSTTARPVFSWSAAPGANRYQVDLSMDSGFGAGTLIPLPIATTTTLTSNVSLAQGTYYWQVWSIDAAGNMSSAPSVSRTFIVDYRTAPLPNATSFTATTSNVIFSWGLAAGASVGTTYTIEIDTDFDNVADFNPPVLPVTVATKTVTLPQGDYQYRLVVSNGLGASGWRPFIVSPLLPGAPVAPFAPATGAFINDTTPTLQWAAPTANPANVTGYTVEVSTTSNFSAPIAGSPFDAGMATSLILPTLPDTSGQIYYWHVRAKAPFNLFSAYNTPVSFTLDTTVPSDVTTLTAPLDAAILSTSRPTFSWGAASGANRYKVQIATDSGFAPQILIDGPLVTTTTYTIPLTTAALQQGTHYWRVWAMDAAGNLSANPSAVRTLVINYPLTPADNFVVNSAAPAHITFTWAAIGGTAANAIQIQIDNNSNFSSPERTSPLLASTAVSYKTSQAGSTPNMNPLPYGKYYWRLKVTGQANSSQVRSFVISPLAPPAPVLSVVTPAAYSADTTPSFGWNAVSSPSGASVTGYELQLATANTFATLVGGASVTISGAGTTSFTWSPALPDTAGQAYFARIRAVTNLGAVSTWSVPRSFTLDTQAPLTGPALLSPADNASVTSQRPTFQWTAMTGMVYDIRYGTQSDLTGVAPIRVTTASYVPAGNLLFRNYTWQVRAIDAAGNAGPYSTARIVSISSALTAAPTLWNYSSSTPTLTWTPLAWALSYEIQVSRTSVFAAADIVWQASGITANGDPMVTVGISLDNGTYYWRVRAIGPMPAPATPKPGPYSATYVVTVEAP